MTNKLLKSVPFALALFAMTFGYSAYNSRAQDKQQQDSMGYDQGHAVDENEMMSAYNSPARIDVTGAWDFFLSGSFIFWQPKMQELQIGLREAAAPGSQSLVNGDVVDYSYKFKPGFKVALGMNFDHDNWDLMAEYTWLYANNSKTVTPLLASRGIYPLWRSHQTNSQHTTVNRANGQWDLHMHLFDLELARCFYVGTKLTFRPHFGLRGSIMDSKVKASYGDSESGSTATTTVDQDTWSVGLRAGLDASYMLGAGFRIAGAAAFSLAYQDFNVKLKEENYYNPSTLWAYYKHDYGFITPNPELRLGLGYGTYFADNAWHFDLEATYDFQVFFNQNMMRNLFEKTANVPNNTQNSGSSGDLFLQGLTVTLRFDF